MIVGLGLDLFDVARLDAEMRCHVPAGVWRKYDILHRSKQEIIERYGP